MQIINDTSILGTASTGLFTVVAAVAVLIGILYVICEWRTVWESVVGILTGLLVCAIPCGFLWLVGRGVQKVLG